MQILNLKIAENTRLTEKMFRMVLSGDDLSVQLPGQFINVQLNGYYLRRPISVCDYENKAVTILYAVVGKGTKQLSEMRPREMLSVLAGLGNGYDTSLSGNAPLLLGGGAGVPPMFLLAKKLLEEGKEVTVCLGFNTAAEVFYAEEFSRLGVKLRLATADGSLGKKGFVTDIMPEDYSYVYTCGPEPMLKAVYKNAKTSGQFSFEERMGCGFGACMGCSCKTITGYKRICKDGPVLQKEEILWED